MGGARGGGHACSLCDAADKHRCDKLLGLSAMGPNELLFLKGLVTPDSRMPTGCLHMNDPMHLMIQPAALVSSCTIFSGLNVCLGKSMID